MSRSFGIVVLVFAFAWSGFLFWRITFPRHVPELPNRPQPLANLDGVHRDLCSLAKAELHFQHSTGRYATMSELFSDGNPFLNDSRWPYRYVLYQATRNKFLILAVSQAPIENQPRVMQIDDQMQVQYRTRPPRTYPCDALTLGESH